MIVRISTEGQYSLGGQEVPELQRLDQAAIDACEHGDEAEFRSAYARLVAFVRERGAPVSEDHLGGSDVILPPPDVSLEEARRELNTDGILPEPQ
jgi:hypothetical protein